MTETAPMVRESTPVQLIEMAIKQNASIEYLERLMALQERWEATEARKAFELAFSHFQHDLPVIEKKKKVNFSTKGGGKMEYSYAPIEDIIEQIRPYLEAHQLNYRFEQEFLPHEGFIRVTCIITHVMGHSITCAMEGPPDQSGGKNIIQQRASSVTYLQRYTLCGALGITTAQEDVDGHVSDDESEALAKLKERIAHCKSQEELDSVVDAIKQCGSSATIRELRGLWIKQREIVRQEANI